MRSFIPWICLVRPGLKSQEEFNPEIERIVCGSTLRSNGFLIPSRWAEVCGSNLKKGKAGCICNNNWKSYTENLVAIFKCFQDELRNPSLLCTGAYHPVSLVHTPTAANVSFFEDEIKGAKKTLLAALGIKGFDEDTKMLIFSNDTPDKSLFMGFLEDIDEITQSGVHVGMFVT